MAGGQSSASPHPRTYTDARTSPLWSRGSQLEQGHPAAAPHLGPQPRFTKNVRTSSGLRPRVACCVPWKGVFRRLPGSSSSLVPPVPARRGVSRLGYCGVFGIRSLITFITTGVRKATSRPTCISLFGRGFTSAGTCCFPFYSEGFNPFVPLHILIFRFLRI